jgi:FkbH-like protein
MSEKTAGADRQLLERLLRERAKREITFALSAEQERFYFLHQLDPSSSEIYVTSSIRLEGSLDVDALQRSVDEIVKRHESLRTVFGVAAGKLVQRVLPRMSVPISVEDLGELDEADRRAREQRVVEDESEARRPLDIERGPLLACTLLRLGARRHRLIVRAHHLVSDIWSTGIFASELATHYEALSTGRTPQIPPLRAQYQSFVKREQALEQDGTIEKQTEHWRRALSGFPPHLELAGDHPRPAIHTQRASYVSIDLPWATYQNVLEVARGHDATPFMLFLAALDALLFRFTGQSKIVVGSSAAARESEELEQMIGVLVDWVLFPIHVDGASTFAKLLSDVATESHQAFASKSVPLKRLIAAAGRRGARDASRNPLFQVMFELLRQPAPIRAGGLDLSWEVVKWRRSHFDLAMIVEVLDAEQRVVLGLVHYADLFSERTARELLDTYAAVLSQVAAVPDVPIASLDAPKAWDARIAAVQPFSLAISSTFTAEPLERPLAFWSRTLSLPTTIRFAPYSQVFQQLLDPGSLLSTNRSGANVLLLREEDLGGERGRAELLDAIARAAARAPQPWLIVTCPPSTPRELDGRATTSTELDALLASGLRGAPNVRVITWSEIERLYPVAMIEDDLAYELGKIPYSTEWFSAAATAIVRTIHGIKRPPVKVVVLDCDNTLWRGVCGEEGPTGVIVDAPRRLLQERMIALHDAGVLLCLASKNEPSDVDAVFAQNPGMQLAQKHIVAAKVSWSPKSQSIRELARELDLGLSSFVFLDDNPVECAEVRAACPEVTVLQVPTDPGELAAFIAESWLLDVPSATAEDRRRTEAYRENLQRQRLQQDAPSFASFLASLEVAIDIQPLGPSNLARASQLTQRTNQFNLTTIRRSESELHDLCDARGHEAFVTHVHDRFGDYGDVGLTVLRAEADALCVDTFLLSCRALGRGVEHAIVRRLGAIARERDLARVELPFRATAKNRPALQFLDSLGADIEERGSERVYVLATERALQVQMTTTETPAEIVESTPGKAGSAPGSPFASVRSETWQRIATELAGIRRIHAAVEQPTKLWAKLAPPAPATTDTERKLVDLWRRVLDLVDVGVHDDYFELGADSLQTVQLVAAAEHLGVALVPADILQHPTIAQLAAHLDSIRSSRSPRARTAISTEGLSLPRDTIPSGMVDAYPLARVQELMALHYDRENRSGGAPSGAYHFQQALRFRDPERPASLAAFGEAFRRLARHQPVMRSVLWRPEGSDRPVQGVRGECEIPIEERDVTALSPAAQDEALERLMAEDRERPFDVGNPREALLRVYLLRRSERVFDYLVVCHHAFGDGWGYQFFLNRLVEMYRALERDDTAAAARLESDAERAGRANIYKELIALEREITRAPETIRFWKRQLDGATAPAAPPRTRSTSAAAEPLVTLVDAGLAEALGRRAREGRVSLKALLLSEYLDLLGRRSSARAISVGVVANGRSERISEPLEAFGLFWNFVPFHHSVGQPAGAQLRSVQDSLNAIEQHALYPLLQIEEDLGGREPFFATFNYIHFRNADWMRPGAPLVLEGIRVFDRFHFPLNWKLWLDHTTQALELTVTHDPRVFDEDTVRGMMRDYVAGLAQLGAGER